MGKKVLAIRYKDSHQSVVLLTVLALSPMWLLWIPYVCYWLLVAGLYGHYSRVLPFIELLGASVVGYIALLIFCVCDFLTITDKGIRFPLGQVLHGRFKHYRLWRDVTKVEFTRLDKISESPTELVFVFGRKRVQLQLDGFDGEELEKLLMALQMFCPASLMTPSLAETDLLIGREIESKSLKSFTELWEEDMSRHLTATAFVPLEAGHHLQNGRLTIVNQIGCGGFSAVYRAKLKDRQVVAVKEFVVPEGVREESRVKATEMFDRESRLLCALEHPRIAKVLDRFVEEGRQYQVLQYVPGPDLRKFVLKYGSQPEEVVLRWALEIAAILSYLHAQNPPIIHRDITPDNLVLEPDGKISLIDFGAANTFLTTATGTLVGKQSYISPEQFRGKAETRSDIFSLGCTMYFIATGRDPEPLTVSSPSDVCNKLSCGFDCLVAKCTAMEATERPQSAMEFMSLALTAVDHSTRVHVQETLQ